MATPQGQFSWFECITPDVDRAKAFYSELFGWTVESQEMDGGFTYNVIKNGENMIGGMLTPPGVEAPPHWSSYISVDDVDATVSAVQSNGGTVLMPARDMAGVGRMALVADPQGGAFQLFKGANENETSDLGGDGGWMWNELWTNDADAAVAFYEKTFGLTHDTMNMGQGDYHVLKVKGAERGHAGVMNSPIPGVPTNWLPYVQVADCDAVTDRAKSLGAEVKSPPQDIPGVGRFSILADPTGATIAVMKPGE